MGKNRIGTGSDKRGFAPILVVVVIAAAAALALAGGIYYFTRKQSLPPVAVVPAPTFPVQEATSLSPIATPTQTSTLAASSTDATAKPLIAENRSSLHLSSGNPILLTDPNGLRTGYDPATGRSVQEIPNSNFTSQAITNIEDENDPALISYVIDVNEPTDGIYTLVLAGNNSGDYGLTMATFSRDGARQSSEELKGTINVGTDTTFQLKFVSAPNQSSTLDTIN